MSLHGASSDRRSKHWMLASVMSAAWLLLAGCTQMPRLRADGLPVVPRYTNTVQLDWLLAGYRQAAENALNSGQVLGLGEEACLGFERTIFDLQSARLYPGVLRMSTESANLSAVLTEFPEILLRHPRPAICESVSEEGVQDTGTGASSSAAQERRQLRQLRTVLGMAEPDGAAPSANLKLSPAHSEELAKLADSAVPAIRLRARFHLLGQCVLAVEAADRTFAGEAAVPSTPWPFGRCFDPSGRAPLRRTQRQLVKSLLEPWASRSLEPFGELVIALVSFASRDNPMLDGPRIIR